MIKDKQENTYTYQLFYKKRCIKFFEILPNKRIIQSQPED